jgi:hypothetical protein
MMFLPHWKHISESPRPVTEIALLFYRQMIFVPHRKHAYEVPRHVMGIASLLYM